MNSLRLSIVIGAHNASHVIGTCLAALEPQCRDRAVEVIVADSSTDGGAGEIERRFPWVRLLHVEEPLNLPALRGRGIAVARGEVIAILDPYSVAAPDWVERVLAAHARQPHAVIGGAVGLYNEERSSYADRANYFYEYGLFMPPNATGEMWIVPGSNVSYKRPALFDRSRPRYPVFWKTFVNASLEGDGSPLWIDGDIRVDLNKPIPFIDFLRTRFDHGRCYGGMRVEGAGAWTRVWRAASTPLVPFLLMSRWTAGFWPKKRSRVAFVLTVPAQLALFTVWACGEACGYLLGAGRSCERLYY